MKHQKIFGEKAHFHKSAVITQNKDKRQLKQ